MHPAGEAGDGHRAGDRRRMNPVLAAREERWARKRAMVAGLVGERPGPPVALASLTLRMPSSLRLSGSYSGVALAMHASFAAALRDGGVPILREEFRVGDDGPESCIAAAADPVGLKRLAAAWESSHPWGALADLDVMAPDGTYVGRAELGLPPRPCLVCGDDGVVCSASRRHAPAELEAVVGRVLLRDASGGPDAVDERIGRAALTAALYEAAAAPKPGLVDPLSNGAHRDMDYFLFLSSAAALAPWFARFARLGRLHRGAPAELLPALREAGKAAERAMFEATGGVNTHKGLIFSLGLLCAAAGALSRDGAFTPRDCADTAAAIARGVTERDLGALKARGAAASMTAGERLYLEYGVRGIRGEAEDGFPSVLGRALPRLRAGLESGLSRNDAMVDALLELCSVVEDTNVLKRAGRDGLALLGARAREALSLGGMASPEGRAAVVAMDDALSARDMSPGGCADLLAVTAFLDMVSI